MDRAAEEAADTAKLAQLVAGGVMDALRHLLNLLGALLGSPGGQAAARDASDSRSLPALSKALKRLWFEAPIAEGEWATTEQLSWLMDLLLVMEGSREAAISFYGAGILLCQLLRSVAPHVYHVAKLEPDAAWSDTLAAVEAALDGTASEELQYLAADHLCGLGVDGLFSTNRLPAVFRRMFDLEGARLTKMQAAGLAVALSVPGSSVVAFGGLGAAFLLRRVRQQSLGTQAAGDQEELLMQLRSQGMPRAGALLRRKLLPIDVTYLPGAAGLGEPQVRVCLYPIQQAKVICAVPAGGFGSDGGSVCVARGERCSMRPKGDGDEFWARIFRPLEPAILDLVLHQGVPIRRGERVIIVPDEDATVKCYTRRLAEPPPLLRELWQLQLRQQHQRRRQLQDQQQRQQQQQEQLQQA